MTTEFPTCFPAILSRLRSLLKQRQVVEASGVDLLVLAELSAMERCWEEREKDERQAFEAGATAGVRYADACHELSVMLRPSYPTFDDYLKTKEAK